MGGQLGKIGNYSSKYAQKALTPLLGKYPQGLKADSNRYLNTRIYSSIIQDSQKEETTQVCVS